MSMADALFLIATHVYNLYRSKIRRIKITCSSQLQNLWLFCFKCSQKKTQAENAVWCSEEQHIDRQHRWDYMVPYSNICIIIDTLACLWSKHTVFNETLTSSSSPRFARRSTSKKNTCQHTVFKYFLRTIKVAKF